MGDRGWIRDTCREGCEVVYYYYVFLCLMMCVM